MENSAVERHPAAFTKEDERQRVRSPSCPGKRSSICHFAGSDDGACLVSHDGNRRFRCLHDAYTPEKLTRRLAIFDDAKLLMSPRAREKSWRADSNRGPADYESAALPTELRQRAGHRRTPRPPPRRWHGLISGSRRNSPQGAPTRLMRPLAGRFRGVNRGRRDRRGRRATRRRADGARSRSTCRRDSMWHRPDQRPTCSTRCTAPPGRRQP